MYASNRRADTHLRAAVIEDKQRFCEATRVNPKPKECKFLAGQQSLTMLRVHVSDGRLAPSRPLFEWPFSAGGAARSFWGDWWCWCEGPFTRLQAPLKTVQAESGNHIFMVPCILWIESSQSADLSKALSVLDLREQGLLATSHQFSSGSPGNSAFIGPTARAPLPTITVTFLPREP